MTAIRSDLCVHHFTSETQVSSCFQTFKVCVQLLFAVDNFAPGYLSALVGGGAAEYRDEVTSDTRCHCGIVEISAGDILIEICDVDDSTFFIYAGASAAAIEVLAANDYLSTIFGFEHAF